VTDCFNQMFYNLQPWHDLKESKSVEAGWLRSFRCWQFSAVGWLSWNSLLDSLRNSELSIGHFQTLAENILFFAKYWWWNVPRTLQIFWVNTIYANTLLTYLLITLKPCSWSMIITTDKEDSANSVLDSMMSMMTGWNC